MEYHVYVIEGKEKFRYTGMTKNLEHRFHEHNSGYNRSTKNHRPYKIIYQRTFPDSVEARKHEKYLKTGSGRDYIDSII